MVIAITGATGFIGKRLGERLRRDGHSIRAIDRAAISSPTPSQLLEGADGVAHLAGEPVAQRWTEDAKKRIRQSRVEGTRNLVAGIRGCRRPPAVLVSSSAIGYYGSRGDERLDETSAPGVGFLPEVAAEWEREAQAAGEAGVRVVNPRTGIVLGVEGGALKKMLPPFRLGLGGPLGDGKQWMSWIHVDDMVGLLAYYLTTPAPPGPVNAVAPYPVPNEDFTETLGEVLRRPAFLPVPGFVLKLLFGEMSQVILGSQRVEPARALHDGFQYRYPELRGALEQLLA